MSIHYTKSVSSSPSKQESRELIAKDLQDSKSSMVLHYLGGALGEMAFENLFKNRMKRTSFVRYEKLTSTLIPLGYVRTVSGELTRLKEDNEYGYFVRGDFFARFFDIMEQLPEVVNNFWLDFCGTPTEELTQQLYDYVFPYMEETAGSKCYVTFFANPRGCKNTKEIFKDCGPTLEERGKVLCKYFADDMFDNIKVSLFQTYTNGPSPMIVLKFENVSTKPNKKTVQEYVELSKKGFSNKQIAVYWKMGIMQVAGYAANAKRNGLI